MEEQLLKLFRERPERHWSGEDLSRLLHCSRTAVWKHIQSLKTRGFEFESAPRRGYRLVREPDSLDAALLASRLTTNRFGRRLNVLGTVDSTQSIAQQWIADGAEEGALVLAEEQTGGRGRRGRPWHSPPGKGVWMSLVLQPQIPLQFTPQLTLLTAVAVCRAIGNLTQLPIGIKWPNDLLIRGKKVCGILLESKAEDERLVQVIAGIGISANLALEDFPETLRDIATSLMIESGRRVDRHELIGEVLSQLEQLYDLYLSQGFEPIRLLWEALNVTVGRELLIQHGSESIQAVATGIDKQGALEVRTSDGQTRKIYSGELEMA
jgi:BirA family biotin operon repressor/biotin-[acetyl-CoA-carboxylase] ligase